MGIIRMVIGRPISTEAQQKRLGFLMLAFFVGLPTTCFLLNAIGVI